MAGTVDELIEDLKQQRDELRVKLHLGSLEAKQEFELIEKKWIHWFAEAKAQSKPLKDVIEDSGKDVGSAIDLVLDEITGGYQRVKAQLKSDN